MIGTGLERGSPERDTEKLVPALRGAAARNLYNARKCDRGILIAHALHGLLLRVNILANKWWARLVPAAAVTPAPRVATTFIGPKASVAGLVNLL